jgi:hypothetical protein
LFHFRSSPAIQYRLLHFFEKHTRHSIIGPASLRLFKKAGVNDLSENVTPPLQTKGALQAMKKSITILVCVALLVILGMSLRSHIHGSRADTAYTTTVQSNISSFEIRKAKTEDTLNLAAHGGGSSLSAPSGPDSKGIRLKTADGWNVEIIR